MKRIIVLAAAVLSAALLQRVSAQEPAPREEPSAVGPECIGTAEIGAEVVRLEERLTSWEQFLKALPKVSGYAQLRYRYNGTDNLSAADIKWACLILSGEFSKQVDYSLMAEFSSPRLVDLYIRYRPFEALNLQAGQFRIPFTIENTEYTPLKLEAIENPAVVQKLVGYRDLSGLQALGRDMGVQLYGGLFRTRRGFHLLSYNIGLFNGNGMSVADNNKSKDVVGRLMVRPIRSLVLSASYYYGEYFTPENPYLERMRYSFGGCYDDGRAVARAEYIGGRTGTLRSDGAYLLLGYKVHRSWQPVVRIDTFCENTHDASTRETNCLVGLNWRPIKPLRVTFNYTRQHYAAAGRPAGNLLALMVEGVF